MKRVKTKILCAGLVVAASVYGFSVQSQESETDSLFRENVEALADFEWNENGWYCWENSYDDNGDFFSPISVVLIVT